MGPHRPYLKEEKFDLKLFPRLHTLDLNLPHDFLRMALLMMATPSLQDLSIPISTAYRVKPDSFAADLLQYIEQSNLIGPDGRCTGVHALKLNPIHYTRQTFYPILETFSCIKKLVFKTEDDRALRTLRHPNPPPPQQVFGIRKDLKVILNMDSNVDDKFLRRVANENSSNDVVNTESAPQVRFPPNWPNSPVLLELPSR